MGASMEPEGGCEEAGRVQLLPLQAASSCCRRYIKSSRRGEARGMCCCAKHANVFSMHRN
eukprot:3818551-Pleurochrysis_carterae.AAC.3